MSSKALKDLQLEIAASQQALVPVIEGLKDFARLNLTPPALEAVQAELTLCTERVRLMEQANKALTALDEHGFPDVKTQEVAATVFADLKDQQTTITAALAKFSTIEEAEKATITAGAPVEQT